MTWCEQIVIVIDICTNVKTEKYNNIRSSEVGYIKKKLLNAHGALVVPGVVVGNLCYIVT